MFPGRGCGKESTFVSTKPDTRRKRLPLESHGALACCHAARRKGGQGHPALGRERRHWHWKCQCLGGEVDVFGRPCRRLYISESAGWTPRPRIERATIKRGRNPDGWILDARMAPRTADGKIGLGYKTRRYRLTLQYLPPSRYPNNNFQNLHSFRRYTTSPKWIINGPSHTQTSSVTRWVQTHAYRISKRSLFPRNPPLQNVQAHIIKTHPHPDRTRMLSTRIAPVHGVSTRNPDHPRLCTPLNNRIQGITV